MRRMYPDILLVVLDCEQGKFKCVFLCDYLTAGIVGLSVSYAVNVSSNVSSYVII